MATLSKPLTCDVCGAPLSVPADDAILSATCAHCQHVQPLPDADRRRKVQEERRARAEQERQRQQYEAAHERTMRSSSRMSLWITLGSFAFAIVIAAVTAGPSILGAWTTVGALTGSPPTAPIPIPLRPSGPSGPPVVIAVTPPPPPRDPALLAEAARTRLGAQMRERVAAGCRRVIMPPEVVTGPKSMTATMVMNRQCVVLLAVAGGPETSLTATMSNPFGEPIPAPTPGPELELRHCPTVAGPHPIRVTPSTNDPYAVAAIECPAGRR